jgi:DNA-binding XRE family transcriptional regulator
MVIMSNKKVYHFKYDFEKFLFNFKINEVREEGYISVLVHIRKRPHKRYERRRFNTDFIRKYVESKYDYNITGVRKGGMLSNYSSNPKTLMRVYEFEIDSGLPKDTKDMVIENTDDDGLEEIVAPKIDKDDVVYEAMDKGSTFGEYVKEYRKANKLTQKQLSEITGISVTRISGIENDKVRPSKEEMKSIFKSDEDDDEVQIDS